MLTKETVIGLVTITELRQLQVREDTIVKEDDVELSRNYHRTIYSPGDDVTTTPQLIQDLATLLWTAEVIQKYKDSIPSPIFPVPPVV